MINIREEITNLFWDAVQKTFPVFSSSQTKAIIQPSGNDKFGDYKCTVAMPIAKVCEMYKLYSLYYVIVFYKLLKQSGESKNPKDIAQKILECLPSSPLIEKVSIIN